MSVTREELKRLAEAAGNIDKVVEVAHDAAKFMAACSPETVLALIAENEAKDRRIADLLEANNRYLQRARDAEGLLKKARAFVDLCIENSELHNEHSGEPTDLIEVIDAHLARIEGGQQ